MAVAILTKPGLAQTAITVESGTKHLGTTGQDFYIKLMDASYDLFSPTAETTGDGDAQPKFENNLLLYGNITLRGAAIAKKKIGLLSLVKWNSGKQVAVDNPIGTSGVAVAHIFLMGGTAVSDSTSGEMFRLKVFVERVAVGFSRSAPFVPVTMRCRVSDMTTTDLDHIENATL